MKFLSVRELRGKAAEIWRRLPAEHELVVTHNGRPVAILTSVAEGNLEDELAAIRQARAMAAVNRLQRQSVERGRDRLKAADIAAEIAAVRRKHAR
jgi:prevent-host-death family protein